MSCTPSIFAFDGRLYVDASRVWLAGGDPWTATYEYGIRYAAPPPSLLATVPLTLLEPAAAGLVMVVVSAVLAYLAIRTLGLPAWWILWAPILDGVLVGSLDIATMALLIVVGGRLSAFAPLLKIYAVLPMAGERRWRALVVAAGLVAITIPILPWDKFLADLALVEGALVDQTIASSAWVFPILVPIFAVGLVSLGLRRAGYLAVPVLWPRTQLHYSALILPVASTSLILHPGVRRRVHRALRATTVGRRLRRGRPLAPTRDAPPPRPTPRRPRSLETFGCRCPAATCC